MKYDLLEPFQKYLYQNLAANTAKTYYAAVIKLFRSFQMEDIRKVSREWLLEETAKSFRTRNEFSAVKNGLKWLGKFYPEFDIPKEEEFKSISSGKRNFSKRPKKVIYLHPTQRKINQIRNPKLKYAYRLGMISGLRVSELAELETKDFVFQEGSIYVNVRHGKGGRGGVVECRQDKYLYEKLPDFLKDIPEGKVFYSASHMQKEAKRLGFECHDLRRIFAIETRNELKAEMPVEKANEIVQNRLRHTRFSVTKRYLFNRKLKVEYEQRKPGGTAKDKGTEEKEEQSKEQYYEKDSRQQKF